MSDRLHIGYDELTVYYRGEPKFVLNKRLLDQQICWNNLDAIKETHQMKLQVYDKIKDEEDPKKLKKLAKQLTRLEFKLQKLWGFPRNANFHRFWEVPKCECPKMDNEDRYPHSQVINQSCPLHGV